MKFVGPARAACRSGCRADMSSTEPRVGGAAKRKRRAGQQRELGGKRVKVYEVKELIAVRTVDRAPLPPGVEYHVWWKGYRKDPV